MPRRPGSRTLLRLLGRRAPRTRGTLHVPGLDASMTIARDRWGIPHVEAQTDTDAWFGLGFCHGQDRGFQLELVARAGRGRLAELLGTAALPLDRLSRTLGFARLAAAQRAVLDADVIATLDAYAAGINAAAHVTLRPHELVLLRAHRTRWHATDVLAFLGLQSLALAGNWDSELARLAILLADGPDALAAVDQVPAAWLPTVVAADAAVTPSLGRLAVDVADLRDLVGGPGASNAWAVVAERTATGAPILANDPHLAPGIPAPWYLAHLRTPQWEVAGASFVGGPAFPSGHNGLAAWGITAGCTDTADLFWEKISADRHTARGPDGQEPVQVLDERIVVRGADPVVERVTLTPRGPVITPLLDGIGVALSLRATWLQPAPVRGLLDVIRAKDFETFRSAFAAWPGPALNVVYADAGGHIGWQLIGSLPRRRVGNGILPTPAWHPGWADEPVPFAEMPFSADPAAGYVASANNPARPDDPDAPFLGLDWLDGYRAAAIVERLAEDRDWDVTATAALQTNVTSMPWREMREIVLGVEPQTDADRRALDLLRAWDGEVAADSVGAWVFELFVAELAATFARAAAPRSWRHALGEGFGRTLARTSFGARTVSPLVDRLRHDPATHVSILPALRTAVTTLTNLASPDPADWAWGTVRPLRLRHPLGAARPLERALCLEPVPLGGDTNTVAQAGVRPLDPLANPAAIANHRMVVDLADVERSRFVLAGGQSGNPLSPHYDDLFELWRRGDGVPIPWSPAAVEAATTERLVLHPAPVSNELEQADVSSP